MSAQKHGMEQVGILDAASRIFHRCQHIAVDEEALTLLKDLCLIGGVDLQAARYHQAQLQCFMPVPGDIGPAHIHMVKGIGILVVQALYFLHLIALDP